jgi:hypothetical protein
MGLRGTQLTGSIIYTLVTFRHGFYWPTALKDAEQLVKHCNGCQHFSKHRNTPATALKTIPLTWLLAV